MDNPSRDVEAIDNVVLMKLIRFEALTLKGGMTSAPPWEVIGYH